MLPSSVGGGTAFDDDGIKSIHYLIYAENIDLNLYPDFDASDDTTWATFAENFADATADLTDFVNSEVAYKFIDLSETEPNQYPWLIPSTPSEVGNFIILASSRDINNLIGYAEPYEYRQFTTNEPPSVKVTKPTDLTKAYSNEIEVQIDGDGSNSKIKKIEYKIESAIKTDALWTSVLESEWTVNDKKATCLFSFDSSDYTSSSVHDIKVRVQVTNMEDAKSPDTYVIIKVDNENPSSEVISPTLKTERI